VWSRVLCEKITKWNLIILCHSLLWMWMYHRYNHASTHPRELRSVTQNEGCPKGCCTSVVSPSTERSCIRKKQEHLSPCCATATSFTSSVTLSSTLTSSRRWHLWGLQRGGNPRIQVLLSKFCDGFLCFQICVC